MTDLPTETTAAEVTSFIERLLAVIDEGRRTATYKLATLLAIMDCCAAGMSPRGEAPRSISTRAIAREVARLYWPQLRPFPSTRGLLELRQITNKSATVVSVLRRVFAILPAVSSWDVAEARLEREVVDQVLDVVELTVARYPLLRLQTIDRVAQPFIYDVDWGESVSMARLHAGAAIALRPGAGEQLIRLAPLVRPLVELHWVRMVADLNQLDIVEHDLYAHLFGAQRAQFPSALRSGLLDMQQGACFYCDSRLGARTAVDHFIPWSRWPNDAVENLVVTDPSCNSHKSDLLPGRRPLERWTARLRQGGTELVELAQASSWRSDPVRTASLARSAYAYLTAETPVWEGPQLIGMATSAELLATLHDL